MASKPKDIADTAVLDRPNPGPIADNSPVLMVGLGRGQTGKSVFARWAIDRARNADRPVVAADGDKSNATLTSYYKDASRPRSADDSDVHAWITDLLEKIASDQVSVALDLGGGDRTLEEYAREFPIVEFCEAHSIRLLIAYFIAPNVDSLAPIATLENSGVFKPTNTIAVLNEGLVPYGMAPDRAFESVRGHPVFLKVLDHAQLVIMPKLSCMPTLEQNRASFFDSFAQSVGPMNAFMTRHWVKQMEAAFAPVQGWLP